MGTYVRFRVVTWSAAIVTSAEAAMPAEGSFTLTVNVPVGRSENVNAPPELVAIDRTNPLRWTVTDRLTTTAPPARRTTPVSAPVGSMETSARWGAPAVTVTVLWPTRPVPPDPPGFGM